MLTYRHDGLRQNGCQTRQLAWLTLMDKDDQNVNLDSKKSTCHKFTLEKQIVANMAKRRKAKLATHCQLQLVIIKIQTIEEMLVFWLLM